MSEFVPTVVTVLWPGCIPTVIHSVKVLSTVVHSVKVVPTVAHSDTVVPTVVRILCHSGTYSSI